MLAHDPSALRSCLQVPEPCGTEVITDAGKSEFKGQPARTTVAIGPAAGREIDLITGPQGLVTTKLA